MSNMIAGTAWEQMTLFAPPPITGTPAISLFDHTTHSSERPSEWMKRLVPDGEYVVSGINKEEMECRKSQSYIT